MQIRCQKGAGTKMHKCLVGNAHIRGWILKCHIYYCPLLQGERKESANFEYSDIINEKKNCITQVHFVCKIFN